jgi:hypothetical protein
MYRNFTLLGAVSAGLLSFRYRKFKLSQMEVHEATRDPNILSNILNDMMCGITGYLISHLICCDYIYKHRQYVIERVNFEKEFGFKRDVFDLAAAAEAEKNNLLKTRLL